MRVPISWLKDLVIIDESVATLAERLSMAGFEVESIEDLAAGVQGVVVGKVKDVSPHPNAEKLSVCSVDVGALELLQIVCGAKNVRSGVSVPVAQVGTDLKSIGLKIKTTQLRGVTSSGMICSLNELGLESDVDGIAILEDLGHKDLEPGMAIGPLLGLNDVVLELAITANRPDGMSMTGIAREIAAITASRTTLPALNDREEYKSFEPAGSSKMSMSKGGMFSLTLLEIPEERNKLPSWLSQRLSRSGLNAVDSIVDITNLVMLEQGQPLHAYDSDQLEKLVGKPITVQSFGLRYAKQDEMFTALDGKKIKLSSDCQVVTCEDMPIALAGVIGSKESAVSSTTKRIWLESAMFTPSSVRINSRNIGLRTEASSRFEKGLPVELTLTSANRATELMSEYLGANIIDRYSYGKHNNEREPILLRRSAIHKLLGGLKCVDTSSNCLIESQRGQSNSIIEDNIVKLSDQVIIQSLQALGCILEEIDLGWNVAIPPSRSKDLKREIDLIEEIARLVGFDNFDVHLPTPLVPGALTHDQKVIRLIRQGFCSSGFQEITTMSLVGPNKSDEKRIPISNPLLAETSHLRTNLIEEHLTICQRNLKASQDGCWIFEIGDIYIQENDQICQKRLLAGGITGERRLGKWFTSGKNTYLDYYQARGLLAQSLQPLKIQIIDKTRIKDKQLHPGRSASLYLEGKLIGRFGQLHPLLADEYQLPRLSYIFDLELDSLITAATRKHVWTPVFTEFPTVPATERDISVIVSKDVKASDITKLIIKAGKPLLENVMLVDRYEGESLDSGKCSQSFRLRYRLKDKTLTDEIVQPIHDNVRKVLLDNLSVELRS